MSLNVFHVAHLPELSRLDSMRVETTKWLASGLTNIIKFCGKRTTFFVLKIELPE